MRRPVQYKARYVAPHSGLPITWKKIMARTLPRKWKKHPFAISIEPLSTAPLSPGSCSTKIFSYSHETTILNGKNPFNHMFACSRVSAIAHEFNALGEQGEPRCRKRQELRGPTVSPSWF